MVVRNAADWMGLSLRSWQLGLDAAAVMGLRSMRIVAGGAIGRREANRMLSEKIAAAADLGPAYARAMTPTPAEAADTLLDIYGPRVRRNKRRLSRR